MADENMVQFSVQPCQENCKENEHGEIEVENEDNTLSDEEFLALNKKLDQLNSVLDTLERKNDDLRAELTDLLMSNREVRKQLQNRAESK